MATRGPAPVDTGVTPVVTRPVDRAPAPVPPGPGSTGQIPTVKKPAGPPEAAAPAVTPNAGITVPPVSTPQGPPETVPPAVTPGPATGQSTSANVTPTVPVQELPVDTPNVDAGNNVIPNINYIQVLANGTVVVSKTTALNFAGSGVTVTGSNGAATITISGSSYGNSNVVTLLSAFGSNTVSTTGNVTGGNLLTGAQVVASGVIQTGTGFSTGGYLSVNGDTDLHKTTVTGNLSATGNITGSYILGNGSQLTGIAASYGNANVVANLAALGTNPVSTTGNVTGGYILGNGSQLTGIAASGNTGNVTFSDQVVIGTGSNDGSGGLYLAPGNASIANSAVQYLRVRGGDVVTHIHLDTGNNQYYDQYFGDDGKYVKLANTGNVVIGSDDAVGNSAQWTFGTSGNLTLPRGGVVYETNIPDGGLNGNTIALAPSGGTNADQQLLIYPTTNDANHLHLTSGNLYSTELFLGDDNLFVKLANTGNVVINSNDGVGNTAQWTFGGDGSLTFPGNLVIAGNTSVFGIDAALLQTTDNRPLIALSSGANGAVSSLWVEDIGNVGTSNIAAVYANPTVGSKIVRIAVGQNGGNTGPNLWDFGATGNLTVPGNIIMTTGIVGSGASPAPYLSGFSSVSAITISASGNITGGNILTGGLVSATGNVTGGYILGNGSQLTAVNAVTVDVTDTNGLTTIYYPTFVENRTTAQIARADVNLTYRTDDNLLTVGNVSVTGNIDGGNLITSAAISTASVSASGNITASNFVGNGVGLTNVTVSAAGNIVGTSSNVSLIAGSYTTTFDNTGNLTLPGNTFSVNYANNTPVNVVTKVESSWAVPVGNSTQSFTVPINNTYQLWVLGNIPNGIIVYNATVSVSNTNVPVIGQQFAWNYEGGGNILMFTSIPAQIIGTAGAISNAQPAVANTNVFTFGINNTSGNTVTVNYGWIAIS
jgi:hypothetical protein